MSISPRLNSKELSALVADINQRLTNRRANKVIGSTKGTKPRFELYHCSLSLCSFKVRTVLAEKSQPYFSHAMSIMPAGKAIPQNYRPEYVRLRLQAAADNGFVSGYSGGSAVGVEGIDPCVVPTLVDHKEGRVVIDSRDICDYIDANSDTGTQLIPQEIKDEVARQTDLVDQAPHVALLYGAHPDEDRRPEGAAKGLKGVHAKKLRALNAVLDHLDATSSLRPAYESKIAKEKAAGQFVVDEDSMRDAHIRGQAHVAELEKQLRTHDSAWVCGDQYTMADILWTISLYRLKWLGNEGWWGPDTGNYRVAEYYERAVQRPSFRSAVADWKYSHSPSPYIEETAVPGMKFKFLLNVMRESDIMEAVFGSDISIPKAR